ncbi:MAG: WD40 repeat domain-containing protein, partial [Deltaproteobacteria bacterium]|nr:WD40 repeat domain-containing protein [Deltaproteobacteria bacterium]
PQIKSATRATPEGLACIQQTDDSLVVMDDAHERAVTTKTIDDATAVFALPQACAFNGRAGARLVGSTGAIKSLCANATAFGRQGSTLLVACGDKLRWFDSAGNEVANRSRQISTDVTALAADDRWLLIGHKTGAIETISLVPGLSAASHALDQTLPSEVTKLIVGPMNTLIAGQLDGNVSIWDMQSGALLERVMLHGAVEHMLLDDKKLYAVSELGDPEVWDLSVLYLSRCELLQQVWSKVPSVWEEGRSVVKAPTAIGECAPAVAVTH